MKELITSFTKHLEEAFSIGEKAKLSQASHPIQNVLVTGMGGSGIGGKVVSQLMEGEASVPIHINNDYSIPAYVNEHTLVIISSYSGNTEETLSAMESACEKKAQFVCITSNGEVLDIAKKSELNHIVIPGGMPPRAAFGYSFTQLFFVLNHFGIITDSFREQLQNAIELLNSEEENILAKAKEISEKLLHKIPIIYAAANYEGVAIRFRQQLNENAKMLAWHHVFPEMNHNELVGWTAKNEDLAILIFRNKNDNARTQRRMEISINIFKKYTSTVLEVHSEGGSSIENALYLIHLGDWISFLLAEKKGIDAVEVNVIDHLKSKLADF